MKKRRQEEEDDDEKRNKSGKGRKELIEMKTYSLHAGQSQVCLLIINKQCGHGSHQACNTSGHVGI